MLPLRLSTVITEMNIHQIVNSVFTSNTYILSVEGKDGHVLIDIGDIAPIKQCVQEKCGTVQALFLTHTHYDHIYGIKDLLRLYPDCTVYTSSFGKEALGSDKLNFSRYHNDPVIWMGDNVTYNPQIQISAESETKRSIFREKDKTKRSKKESAQHSKSRNKSFVMTSVSAL